MPLSPPVPAFGARDILGEHPLSLALCFSLMRVNFLLAASDPSPSFQRLRVQVQSRYILRMDIGQEHTVVRIRTVVLAEEKGKGTTLSRPALQPLFSRRTYVATLPLHLAPPFADPHGQK